MIITTLNIAGIMNLKKILESLKEQIGNSKYLLEFILCIGNDFTIKLIGNDFDMH